MLDGGWHCMFTGWEHTTNTGCVCPWGGRSSVLDQTARLPLLGFQCRSSPMRVRSSGPQSPTTQIVVCRQSWMMIVVCHSVGWRLTRWTRLAPFAPPWSRGGSLAEKTGAAVARFYIAIYCTLPSPRHPPRPPPPPNPYQRMTFVGHPMGGVGGATRRRGAQAVVCTPRSIGLQAAGGSQDRFTGLPIILTSKIVSATGFGCAATRRPGGGGCPVSLALLG